jgi:hypothetical protein
MLNQPDATLTPIQQDVLNLLATGSSLTDAATGAGVHRNTIMNWRRTIPAFTTLLDQATRDRAQLIQDALAPKAIEVLEAILYNEAASPSVRLRAALSVLKMPPPQKQEEPPAPRPAITEALEDGMRKLAEQQNEIRENMHNFAQRPKPQPIRIAPQPGRNTQCPCSSGLKFKRCCANKPLPTDQAAA